MSKPIDQEREAFEAAFPIPPGIVWSGKEYVTQGRQEVNMFVHLCRVAAAYDKMHAVWQARAAVQPAGVAVPEGWKLVPIKPTAEMKVVCRVAGKTQVWADMIAASLAAPHPVSGEQKPDALRKRFSDIEDEIMAGKHNAASVFTAMRTAALYIGQPAAQDVAGLAEAVRDYLSAVHEQLPNPLKVTAAMLQMKKALAAHRAQAQQGDQHEP